MLSKDWIIGFDEAIQILNTYGIKGQGFADDCGPMIGGNEVDTLCKSMQRMLNRLYHWGKSKTLTFNLDKSIAVLFSKKT